MVIAQGYLQHQRIHRCLAHLSTFKESVIMCFEEPVVTAQKGKISKFIPQVTAAPKKGKSRVPVRCQVMYARMILQGEPSPNLDNMAACTSSSTQNADETFLSRQRDRNLCPTTAPQHKEYYFY